MVYVTTMTKEEILKLIGDDRSYDEYKEHGKDYRLCICMDCNRTWGINKERERMREEVKDFFKED